MSFVSTGRDINERIDCRPPSKKSCGPFRSAGLKSWEGIWIDATLAVLNARPITPAVTATVPNASPWPKPSGWRSKPLSFCRWDTSIWCLPCHTNLTGLILAHKKIGLSLLFKAVSETLLEFGQTRLKGTLGIIAVLHTWDQTLKDHFHLHCLIPAGALSLDHRRWISARKNFLFPVKALSRVFRGKFLARLQQACDKGKIPAANNEIKASRQKNWVVYTKKPFGSPHTRA